MDGLSDRVATLRQHFAELAATLRDWPWYETLHTLRQRFGEDRLGLTAGSLTFTTLIALVPLLTVALAVFSAFPMFGAFQMALEKYFLQALVPENIARPVLRSLTEFAVNARGVGTLGLLVLVVTALAMVLTIDRTLNQIWRVRQKRSFTRRVLIYWAALTLGPLVLGVSLTLTSYALTASTGYMRAEPGGLNLLFALLQFFLLATAMAALYQYVPNTAVRWRHAWAGGLFVAVSFEFAKRGLAWYVEFVPTYSAVYGAFATAPIMLLWIYLVWVIVLLGAVIAAYAPSLQMRVTRRAPTPGWRFELALAMLRRLDGVRLTPQRGLTVAALAEAMRADPLQLEPLLELLSELDWVARLDEGAHSRYVLLCDPATTPLVPLMHRVLLAPGPASECFVDAAGLQQLTMEHALRRPPAA
jgi:membrane protein